MSRVPKRGLFAGGVIAGVAAVLLCCLVLPTLFVLSSCSVNQYVVAFGLPKPDAGFQTGTVFGYNVWIWECHQGKRIVLYNETSEMYAGPFVREEAPCGQQTPIERKLANERTRPMDPDSFL